MLYTAQRSYLFAKTSFTDFFDFAPIFYAQNAAESATVFKCVLTYDRSHTFCFYAFHHALEVAFAGVVRICLYGHSIYLHITSHADLQGISPRHYLVINAFWVFLHRTSYIQISMTMRIFKAIIIQSRTVFQTQYCRHNVSASPLAVRADFLRVFTVNILATP